MKQASSSETAPSILPTMLHWRYVRGTAIVVAGALVMLSELVRSLAF